jgi:hypothetical protein
MRADHPVYYGTDGRGRLVTTSPDRPYVVSAYLEHNSCASWHFGYTKREQEAIAKLVSKVPNLRRALLFAWSDAVDPHIEGHQPATHLDLIITDDSGWAVYPTGERHERYPVELLTVDEHNDTPSPVRFGRRAIFADRPDLPVDQIRQAGVEFIQTGELPTSVAWQRRVGLVPLGSFGRHVVAEKELPPTLDWSYPDRAQPWAIDPPALPV